MASKSSSKHALIAVAAAAVTVVVLARSGALQKLIAKA